MTRRGATTAAEFLASREADPEWVAWRQAGRDADAVATRLEEIVSRSLLDDLREAGVSVTSVWDLVNQSEPYPDALPVLVRHLAEGGV